MPLGGSLGFFFKISDEQPHPFFIGVLLGGGALPFWFFTRGKLNKCIDFVTSVLQSKSPPSLFCSRNLH